MGYDVITILYTSHTCVIMYVCIYIYNALNNNKTESPCVVVVLYKYYKNYVVVTNNTPI
jgi:hypothetical protein